MSDPGVYIFFKNNVVPLGKSLSFQKLGMFAQSAKANCYLFLFYVSNKVSLYPFFGDKNEEIFPFHKTKDSRGRIVIQNGSVERDQTQRHVTP